MVILWLKIHLNVFLGIQLTDIIIGLGNGWALTKRQVIWIYVDYVHWHKYQSLGLSELS